MPLNTTRKREIWHLGSCLLQVHDGDAIVRRRRAVTAEMALRFLEVFWYHCTTLAEPAGTV